jgi:hypothetical protein
MKKRRKRFSYSKYINLNPTTDDSVNGRKVTTEDVKKRYQDDPSHREWGTDSLTNIYKNDTPGQEPKLKSFKQFLKTEQVTIRTADGEMKKLTNVPIRMASGEMKSMPPGKSGSSGGGNGN